MRLPFFALVLLFILPAHAELKLDTTGAEAWLRCAQTDGPAEACNAASAATEGGQMAELAIPTFGPLPAEHPADPSPDAAAALLKEMMSWDLAALEPRDLFGALGSHAGRIFVVGSGAYDWGDAYVRNYRRSGGKLVLDDAGEPVIIINLRLVARYRGTPAEQAATVRDILRHEIFHITFAWYRAGDARWQKLSAPTKDQDLILSVEDEGIAHFLASETTLKTKGFPQDHARQALADLEAAVIALRQGTATDEMLQRANQGPYWSKYASISGALFAYGIDKVFGRDGLKQSLARSPAAFVLRYGEAAAHDSSLPALPQELAAWAKAHMNDL